MKSLVTGKATFNMNEPDASGNVGYSLSYDFKYQKENPMETIEYLNIKFSGPGSWRDYCERDDYPYNEMLTTVLSKT